VKQILQPQDIKEDAFTHQEFQKVKKSTIESKASGPDGIPSEVFGDLGLTDNYRGITLSSVAAKIINKMLLKNKTCH